MDLAHVLEEIPGVALHGRKVSSCIDASMQDPEPFSSVEPKSALARSSGDLRRKHKAGAFPTQHLVGIHALDVKPQTRVGDLDLVDCFGGHFVCDDDQLMRQSVCNQPVVSDLQERCHGLNPWVLAQVLTVVNAGTIWLSGGRKKPLPRSFTQSAMESAPACSSSPTFSMLATTPAAFFSISQSQNAGQKSEP
jgi:hypothetical protein